MKSFLALALLVGVALSNSTSYYGWKPNRELRYRYESEVLTGIPDIKHSQWAGVKLQADVVIQTFRDYTLRLKFENSKAVVFNREDLPIVRGRPVAPRPTEELPGWFKTHLEKPFEAHLRRGVIEKTYYERDTPAQVINIQKGLLSQLQMDLSGLGRGFLVENNFVSGGKPTEVPPLSPDQTSFFSTLESTVEGECQTDYTFVPMPKFQSYNLNYDEEVKEKELRQEGLWSEGKTTKTGEEICEGKQYYEVVKTRNYNNCVRRPIFQISTGIHHSCDASKGYCQDLFAHISTTRYVICGEREEFYIREVETNSDIQTNPFGWNTTPEKMKQLARIVLTIQDVKESGFTPMPKPSGAEERETLNFEYPVGHHDAIPEKKLSHEEVINPGNTSYIHPIRHFPGLHSESNILNQYIGIEELKEQFVPEFVKAVKIFFKLSDNCSGKKDVSGLLTSLSMHVRPLSYNNIKTLEKTMKSHSYENQKQKELAIVLFYDVLAMSGSNPSLMVIKDLIQDTSSMLPVYVKSKLIISSFRSTFTPTSELLKEMFNMVKSQKHSEHTQPIYTNGLIGITNLVYRACIDPMTSLTGYPVRIYGKFCSKDTSFITDELIPYLIRELESYSGSSSETEEALKLITISALGKIGHKKALIPLAKVIQDERESPMTRSLAVNSLKRLARQEPTMTRRILLSIIDNPAEHTEVRISAIAVLPYSQPSVTELQKMAVRSWFEPSKQVGSFTYSTLKHLVGTQNPELKSTGDKVRTLIHLVKPFQTGMEFSQNIQMNNYVRYLLTASSGEFSYISGDSNIIPTRLSFSNGLFGSTWKINGLTFTTYTKHMNTLWNKILSQGPYKQVSIESKQKLEKLDQKLGMIKGNVNSKPKGFFQIKSADFETMYQFSARDYDEILKKVSEVMKTPIGSHSNDEQHHHFANFHPYVNLEAFGATQTGIPIYLRRTVPVIYGIRSTVKSISEYGTKTELMTEAVPIFNSKVLGTMGVILPFAPKIVATNVEMSLHFTLPVSTRFSLNKEQGKADISIKMLEDPSIVTPGDIETFHFFTNPTTLTQNLKQLTPVGKSSDVKTIFSGEPKRQYSIPIGKSVGIESSVHINSDYKHLDFPGFVNTLRQHNVLSLFSLGTLVPSVRQNSIKLTLNIGSSTTKELETTFSMVSGMKSVEWSGIKVKSPFCEESSSSLPWEKKGIEELKEELKQKCKQIGSLSSYEIEKCVEHEISKAEGQKKVTEQLKEELSKMKEGSVGQGWAIQSSLKGSSPSHQKTVKITGIGAVEKLSEHSNRIIFNMLLKKSSSSGALYSLKTEIKNQFPKVPFRWEVESLIRNPVEMESDVSIRYGHGEEPEHKININSHYQKSEHLKDELRNSEEYAKCKEEMGGGHKLASVCEELRHQSASVNQVHLTFTLPEYLDRSVYFTRMEEFVRSYLFTNVYHLTPNEGSTPGRYEITARVNRHGDEGHLDVKTPMYKFELSDVRIPRVAVPFLPFSLRNPMYVRLLQKVTRDQSPASCRLNEKWVSTFDNRTYEYELTKPGCKVLLYKDCDEKNVNKPVSVTAEKGPNYFKTVEFVSGTHIVKLSSTGSSTGNVKVTVDGKEVSLSPSQYWTKRDSEGRVAIILYKYQDGVVGAYNPLLFAGIFYDGRDVEIVSPQLLNKNRACGLCGDNNGEYTTDVRTPKHCVMSEPRLGGYSYILERREECVNGEDLKRYNEDTRECSHKKFYPTPVVPLARSLISRSSRPGSLAVSPATHLIDETPNYICISTKPITNCPRGQHQTESKGIDIPMTCLPKYWPASHQMAKRAAEGELISELSRFPPTLYQRVFVPTKCSGGSRPYNPTNYRTKVRDY